MKLLPFCLLALAAALVVNGQPDPQTGCQPVYDSVTDLAAALNAANYPAAKIDTACLSASCSSLASTAPCPYNKDSTTEPNATAINEILSATSTCLKSLTSLCTAPLTNIPLCATGITLQALFNNPAFNGSVNVAPGSGSVNGLPQATFAYDAQTNTYVINATLAYQFLAQGFMGIANNSYTFPFDNVNSSATFDMSVTTQIVPANDNPVTVVSAVDMAQGQFGQLFPQNTSVVQLQEFQKALNNYTLTALQNSKTPNAVGTFLGTILAKACLLAEKNCKA